MVPGGPGKDSGEASVREPVKRPVGEPKDITLVPAAVSDPDLRAWDSHIEKRWWRKDWKFFMHRKYARFQKKRQAKLL